MKLYFVRCFRKDDLHHLCPFIFKQGYKTSKDLFDDWKVKNGVGFETMIKLLGFSEYEIFEKEVAECEDVDAAVE